MLRVPPPTTCMSLCDLGPGPLTAWSHRHAHRTSMRTVKGLTRLARLFKRSLLVLSVKVAFTLLLPWIRRHEDFYRFTRILYPAHFYHLTPKCPHFYPTPTLWYRTTMSRSFRKSFEPLSHRTAAHNSVTTETCFRCVDSQFKASHQSLSPSRWSWGNSATCCI